MYHAIVWKEKSGVDPANAQIVEILLSDIFVKSYDTFPTNLVGDLNVAHAL